MEKENNSLNKDDNYNKYKSINIILPSHIKQSSINLNNIIREVSRHMS